MDLQKVEEVLLDAARRGAMLALKAQRELGLIGTAGAAKADTSPVTVADYAAQASMVATMAAAFPSTAVCAEEDGRTLFEVLNPSQVRDVTRLAAEACPQLRGDHDLVTRVLEERGSHGGFGDGAPFFVVDPIDGTKGFLRGGQYAVCCGLVDERGRGTIGVVACPSLPSSSPSLRGDVSTTGCLYSGLVDGALEGLWEHSLVVSEAPELRRRVIPRHRPAPPVTVVESFESSHREPALALAVKTALGGSIAVDRMDSQVKFALTARGDAHVYPRVSPHDQAIWDILPGALLVEAAGGRVTDAAGRPVDYSRGRTIGSRVVLASAPGAGAMHAAMVAALAKY